MKRLFTTFVTITTLSLATGTSTIAQSLPATPVNDRQPILLARRRRRVSQQLFVKVKVTPRGTHKQFLILTSNGRAIRSKAGDLSWIQRNINRRNIGRYRRSRNRLTIHWPDGRTWQMTSRRNGWQRGRSKNFYAAAIPMRRRRLSGRYIATSSRSVGFIGGSAPRVSAHKKNVFIFSPNGRFRSSGFAGANGRTYGLGGRPNGGGVGTAKNRNYGRYAVQGYNLGLQYANGKRLNHTIFQLPGWRNTIFIGGQMYQRK